MSGKRNERFAFRSPTGKRKKAVGKIRAESKIRHTENFQTPAETRQTLESAKTKNKTRS